MTLLRHHDLTKLLGTLIKHHEDSNCPTFTSMKPIGKVGRATTTEHNTGYTGIGKHPLGRQIEKLLACDLWRGIQILRRQ